MLTSVLTGVGVWALMSLNWFGDWQFGVGSDYLDGALVNDVKVSRLEYPLYRDATPVYWMSVRLLDTLRVSYWYSETDSVQLSDTVLNQDFDYRDWSLMEESTSLTLYEDRFDSFSLEYVSSTDFDWFWRAGFTMLSRSMDYDIFDATGYNYQTQRSYFLPMRVSLYSASFRIPAVTYTLGRQFSLGPGKLVFQGTYIYSISVTGKEQDQHTVVDKLLDIDDLKGRYENFKFQIGYQVSMWKLYCQYQVDSLSTAGVGTFNSGGTKYPFYAEVSSQQVRYQAGVSISF